MVNQLAVPKHDSTTDVLQGGNRLMQPGRYKSRILRFWGMPVAANGESILLAGDRSPSRPVAQPSVTAQLPRRPRRNDQHDQDRRSDPGLGLTCTLAPLAGLEPATYGLEVRCSIH